MRAMSLIHSLMLMFAANLNASAATWEPVRIRPGVSFMELDAESVIKLSSGNQFAAIWRSGLSLDKAVTLVDGVVDCENESITISKRTFLDGKNPPMVTDYLSGTLASGTYKSELSAIEKGYGNVYPVSTTDEGLLIANVCQRLNGLPEPKADVLAPLRRQLACSAGNAHFVCREDPVSEALTRSLLVRLGQAELVCPIDRNQLGVMADAWLTQASKDCKVNQLSCGKSYLEITIGGLGADLARQNQGDTSCKFAQDSVKSALLDNKKTASVELFRKCAVAASISLDDYTSGADVIAQAVFSKCQQELHPELSNNKAFKDAFTPQLLGIVLDNRNKRVAPSKAPSKPNRKIESKPKVFNADA